MPTKTIAYLRVSTDKQADRGVSLDAQRAKVAAYAELYDLELAEVIVDAGESAKSLDRPGLQRALGMLKRGEGSPASNRARVGRVTPSRGLGSPGQKPQIRRQAERRSNLGTWGGLLSSHWQGPERTPAPPEDEKPENIDLRRGPLPVNEASGYALQLAQGLSAAHEKGSGSA